ncbi:hypothetical protein D3C74_438000 [compost metagenome]
MVAFSWYEFDLSTLDKEALIDDIKALMSRTEFVSTIASSTNSPEKVKLRISMFEDLISRYGVRKIAK